MDKRRCVILGGAPIGNYPAVKAYLRDGDAVIACDAGLRHLEPLGVTPALIVGDFDSHENPHLAVETIVLPHEKDDTDTMYAVREALSRGFGEFLLLGVFGARLDHTLGNLGILHYLDSRGVPALAVDDFSEMCIVSRGEALVSDAYPYFSLLAADGPAEGVTIRDALYTLEDARITPDWQVGVSNEPLPGRTARITVRKGRLLLIRDRKE